MDARVGLNSAQPPLGFQQVLRAKSRARGDRAFSRPMLRADRQTPHNRGQVRRHTCGMTSFSRHALGAVHHLPWPLW